MSNTITASNSQPYDWDKKKNVGCIWGSKTDNDDFTNESSFDSKAKWKKLQDIQCSNAAAESECTDPDKTWKDYAVDAAINAASFGYYGMAKNAYNALSTAQKLLIDQWYNRQAGLGYNPDKLTCPPIYGNSTEYLDKDSCKDKGLSYYSQNAEKCGQTYTVGKLQSDLPTPNTQADIDKPDEDYLSNCPKSIRPTLECSYDLPDPTGGSVEPYMVEQLIKMAGFGPSGWGDEYQQNGKPYISSQEDLTNLDNFMAKYCFKEARASDLQYYPRALINDDSINGSETSANLCKYWREGRRGSADSNGDYSGSTTAWDTAAEEYCESTLSRTIQPDFCKCTNLNKPESDEYDLYVAMTDSQNGFGPKECWYGKCNSGRDNYIVNKQIYTSDILDNPLSDSCTGINCVAMLNVLNTEVGGDIDYTADLNCPSEEDMEEDDSINTNPSSDLDECETSDDCGFFNKCSDTNACTLNSTLVGVVTGSSLIFLILIILVIVLIVKKSRKTV